MGVSHLWELLAPSGKYCSLTTLKNKRLAIDASVWISQLVAGMVDDRGNPIPNAHLKGLFTRVCKLLFFGIKPVFVFDGGVPALKQRTIAARRRRREDAERNYRKTAEKLLMQRLGLEFVEKQTERKRRGKRKRLEELEEEEMLAFSQLEQSQNEAEKEKGTEEETKEEIERRNDEVEIWELEAQPELEETRLLSALGIDPEVYAALPEELQEEVRQSVHSRQVVLEMREEQSILTGEWDDPILQRHRLNAQLLQSQMSIKHNNPKAAQDFSQQQLQNLVKNGEMWRKIKQTKEEIKHSLSSSNLSTSENRIASDSTREYMLISVDEEAEKEKELDTEDHSTSPSKKKRVDKGKEKMDNYSRAETFSFSRFFDEEGQGESISGGGVLTAEGEDAEQEVQGGGFLIESSDDEDEVEVQSKLKEKEEKHSERRDKGKEKEVEPQKEKEQEKEAIVFYRKQTSSVSEEKQQEAFQFLEEPVLPPGPNVSPIKKRTSILEQPQKVNEIYGVEEQEESGIDITFDPTKVTTTDIFDFSLFEQPNTNGEEEKGIQKEKRKEQDFLFEDELLAIQLQEEEDDDDELKDRHSSDTELNNATEPAPANAPSEIDTSIDTSIYEIHRQLEMEAILLSQKAKQQGKAIQSVTNEMLSDCQELLQLFGIPYVISPMEAEAQCGYLNANGLVHGVVTEDSDIFLVGGLTVYKKFFSKEHLEAYSLGDIKRKLGLDRQKLIELALLLGSDYTEGVKGIGPVHAMEVISTFESLDAFKKWWESPNTDDFSVDEKEEDRENEEGDEKENANGRVGFDERDYKRVSIKLRQLKKRIKLRKDFPSQAVVEAYLHPQVDESLESFEWGKPDLDGLRKFAAHKMGWSEERADELVIPLLKKSVEEAEQEAEKESTTTQKTLDDWFLQIPKKLESVRVHNAIQHLVSNNSNKNTAGTKAKRGRKTTATTTAKKKGSATKKTTTPKGTKKKNSKK